MPSKNPSTREFPTEQIAESAANLARVMGYAVTIEKKDDIWQVAAVWTPQVEARFKERFGEDTTLE